MTCSMPEGSVSLVVTPPALPGRCWASAVATSVRPAIVADTSEFRILLVLRVVPAMPRSSVKVAGI